MNTLTLPQTITVAISPINDVFLARGSDTLGLPSMPLLVTNDDFFPGQVFTGTAEDVYNEMFALNPASVDPLPSPPVTTLNVTTSSLEDGASVRSHTHIGRWSP
jgi:hypothetical protein